MSLKSRIAIVFSAWASILAGCANNASEPVFPSIDNLSHTWIDDDGAFYSVMQDDEGELNIHNIMSGDYYSYSLENQILARWPSHAPDVKISEDTIYLGEMALHRYPFHAERFEFSRGGVSFKGILTLPDGVSKAPVIIIGHGSGKDAATGYYWNPTVSLIAGYGSLLFDRRGTGESGGSFTHDFEILADDIGATVQALAMDPRIDASLIGVAGYSQSVYVAPLVAARHSGVAFITAAYGMTEPPIMEDRLETKQMFEANYPKLDWKEFEPLVIACEQAFAQRDNSKWETVSHYKKQWKHRVNASDFSDTMTGDACLQHGSFLLKMFGRSQLPEGLLWSYEPIPVIDGLDIPILWQFAEDDRDAPSATSITQVKDWQNQGKDFTLFVYSGAEHAMIQWLENSDGQAYWRRDAKYFADQIDWLKALAKK